MLGLLSVASGMPLGWVYNSLQFWLYPLGITKATLSLLSSVSLPWSLKVLWSPLVDRFALPRPGRRRSWIMIAQIALAGAFGLLAMVAFRLSGSRVSSLGPGSHWAVVIGLLALAVAFCSATQDIALDAYAVEVLEPREQGPASGLRVMYYRLGMLLAGAGAISASDVVPWPVLFLCIGGLFLGSCALTWAAPEPKRSASPPRSLVRAVWEPLRSFSRKRNAFAVALFLFAYKFGDNLGGTMVNPFLKDLCFSNHEAGLAIKTIGTVATIGGAALGAAIMGRTGLGRALWVFGILQAGANLLYSAAALSCHGPIEISACRPVALSMSTRVWTYAGIAGEQASQGMATSAMLALILRVCDKRYSATQYALLSSLFGLGRTVAGLPSGWLAERLGYPSFFLAATLAAIPGLLVLQWIAPIGQRDVIGLDASTVAGTERADSPG